MTALVPGTHGSANTIAPSAIPIALVELDDFTIRSVNPAALRRIGRSTRGLRGRSVLEAVAPRDRRAATAALTALRNGDIHFYLAHRAISGTSMTDPDAAVWVRAVDLDGERLALIEFGSGAESRSSLAELAGREPHDLAIGCLDDQWTVTAVSRVTGALAMIADLVGANLLARVSHDDRTRLLEARRHVESSADAVALQITIRYTNDERPASVCLVITAVDSGPLLIIIMPIVEAEQVKDRRTTRLESHLRAIAREVQASGVLSSTMATIMSPRTAELASLTARQWEVLSRLLRGDRVPTIADELYVSQSTVRNHLSGIFKAFGVSSQAQLLALLR